MAYSLCVAQRNPNPLAVRNELQFSLFGLAGKLPGGSKYFFLVANSSQASLTCLQLRFDSPVASYQLPVECCRSKVFTLRVSQIAFP
jgi:hypothetical protein